MTTEVYDDPQAFMAALTGKKRKPAKEARPGLPRAAAGEGDRIAQLGRIAVYHFHPRWRAGVGFDFWHTDGRATTACADYATACITAERELTR
jgi:hypothetical protein